MKTLDWWGIGRFRGPLPSIFLIRHKDSPVWLDVALRRKPFTKRKTAENWLRRNLRKYMEFGNNQYSQVSKSELDRALTFFEIVEIDLVQITHAPPPQNVAFTGPQFDAYRDGFHEGKTNGGAYRSDCPHSDFETVLWWQNGYEDAGREFARVPLLFPELRRLF